MRKFHIDEPREIGKKKIKLSKSDFMDVKDELTEMAVRKKIRSLIKKEAITIPIEIGDTVLGGKFKNKRIEVKEFGKDALGQPTINGRPILKFRIEKHLPDAKKSKKTRDLEKAEEEGEKE